MENLAQHPIVIVGPTASGKTEAALILAAKLKTSVVSADSRQIYKDLSAGTAKPRGRWEAGRYVVDGIPYHMLDFLDPAQSFNAGAYVRGAAACYAACGENAAPPVMAGGTGLYVKAFWEGLDEMPPADAAVRGALLSEARNSGPPALHRRLKDVDPVAAGKIHPENLHRLVRALEVYELTGRPISNFWEREALPRREGQPLFFGILWEKTALHARIQRRCEAAFKPMLEEVLDLTRRGYAAGSPGLRSLGYPQAAAHLKGEVSYQQGLERYIQLTRQYAKRQRTWFRRQHPARWIEIAGESAWKPEAVAERILGEAQWKKSS